MNSLNKKLCVGEVPVQADVSDMKSQLFQTSSIERQVV